MFNAQQIEKAEHCGSVYNVETNDVEEPEKMVDKISFKFAIKTAKNATNIIRKPVEGISLSFF